MSYSNVKRRRLNAKISKELRFEMDEFLQRADTENPIICLIKDTDSRWIFGSYGPENIETVAPMLEEVGEVLLYELEDYLIACPQYDQISDLEGKSISCGNIGEGLLLNDADI